MSNQNEKVLDYSGLLSVNRKMKSTFHMIGKIAPTNSTVLILGETGSGKELVAKAIHERSPRSGGPFIAINCATLSENLLESELFGHERGSFTGAVARKHGLLEVADKGTLFLDEIAEMHPVVQTKLLRALETRSFMRIGGTETIHVDVRFLIACQSDLKNLVTRGIFRSDLYFRLSTITISIPPLRERRDDVSVLVQHALEKFGPESKKEKVTVEDRAMEALVTYDWPGNVRELENVIERALVLSRGMEILVKDLPRRIRKAEVEVEWSGLLPLEEVKRMHILRVLQEVRGNKSQASKILGIGRKTLYRKIEEYGIDLKKLSFEEA
ncbi:sigma-54-dependent Fis family transcriptional regulator [candidate division TA06 bacterium]|nr:sigma-54-dependent Fis family transcriptional regulator [candidate division TA06 bacterium]